MNNEITCCFFLVLICFHHVCFGEINEKIGINTELTEKLDKRLLLFSTLDGGLFALDRHTGKIKWKIKDQPIVRVPLDISEALIPFYLPDPRDGSLYLMGNNKEPLKKLPFNIPQLVHSSPCRSSDGILYTGKKKDIWYKLDPEMGTRQQILGWDETDFGTCPVEMNNFVYIGRTKYTIMMVDTTKENKRWNVTFYDYTAGNLTSDELNNYDLVHFASTSSGKILTLDRRRGTLIWENDLNSPVIAVYLLSFEGLFKVPFTSLSNYTIHYIANEINMHSGLLDHRNHMKLYPTLFIGEHIHGLYAIPSLIDHSIVSITTQSDDNVGLLLIEGPNAPKLYPELHPLPGHNYKLPKESLQEENYFHSLADFKNHIVIYTGHYNIPRDYSESNFIGPNNLLLKRELEMITDESEKTATDQKKTRTVSIQTETSVNNDGNDKQTTEQTVGFIRGYLRDFKNYFSKQEHNGLHLFIVVLIGAVISMFWYLLVQVKRVREVQNMSQNDSRSSSSSTGRYGQITAYSEELPGGLVKIGKITFSTDQLLGKGCEGTFVYRGEFDNRRVAVKRLLPECFTFADREVALLRESDAHPNVIRYYCMEQDRMFRYIALELCQATLSEYMQGKCNIPNIQPLEILCQATTGLAHLHSLDIVHRDIKPHNVLISVPDYRGEVKAMISDFGLCKKLQFGKASFSRRSGVTGTDGWIAPEMLNGSARTTAAVDMFSLGCVYYYVLSNGAHPFGDVLHRQANIIMGQYQLTQLKGQDWEIELQKPLVEAMLSAKPENRPSCKAVLAYPIFWTKQKMLSFLQDVSDRVDKIENDDDVLNALENNIEPVVRQDWRYHVDTEVAKDLRKYRTYRGKSVRDLLRALRNKKHHYRELSKEAQDALGTTNELFLTYWTDRFPLLLVHAYLTMQCVSHESSFQSYYDQVYKYSLEIFKHQVNKHMEMNPVHLPEDVNLEDHLDRKKLCFDVDKTEFYEKCKYSKYNNNNSRRIQNNFDKMANKRHFNQNLNIVNVNDLHVNFNDNPNDMMNMMAMNHSHPKKRMYPVRKPNKKKKKPDEPLVWAIKGE